MLPKSIFTTLFALYDATISCERLIVRVIAAPTTIFYVPSTFLKISRSAIFHTFSIHPTLTTKITFYPNHRNQQKHWNLLILKSSIKNCFYIQSALKKCNISIILLISSSDMVNSLKSSTTLVVPSSQSKRLSCKS